MTCAIAKLRLVPAASSFRLVLLLAMQDTYGPFEPNSCVDVPIWLALMLHKRRKCTILQPAWMEKDKLAGELCSRSCKGMRHVAAGQHGMHLRVVRCCFLQGRSAGGL